MFDNHKTRIIGLPCGEKNYNNILRRFHRIPEGNGRTDRHICYIDTARQCALTRDKNSTAGFCQTATKSDVTKRVLSGGEFDLLSGFTLIQLRRFQLGNELEAVNGRVTCQSIRGRERELISFLSVVVDVVVQR